MLLHYRMARRRRRRDRDEQPEHFRGVLYLNGSDGTVLRVNVQLVGEELLDPQTETWQLTVVTTQVPRVVRHPDARG